MHFVNISDLAGQQWRFLEKHNKNPDLTWSVHYGRARNTLERLVPRPALGRYRAAITGALEARQRPDSVLVSHLPRVSAACNVARMRLCPDRPHIAFAFNFTDIPERSDRKRLTRWLRSIDSYVVFSRYEQSLYSEVLNLPAERVHHLPWTMETPELGPENPVGSLGPYLVSIGGEGRDYALLADAMRQLPDVKLVIIARPYSIAGLEFPSNVTVFTNLPAPQTWRIAADSQGMVIPLKTDTTACGHITIVGSQLLGLPVVATRSLGIEDYITDGVSGHLIPAKNLTALKDCIHQLHANPDAARKLGRTAQGNAQTQNNPQLWLDYFEGFAKARAV